MHDLLRLMVSKDGSDLFITTGSPPAMKIDGKVATVSKQNLSPNHTQMLARSIMNDKQVSEFEEKQECNFSISLPGVARFRVNAFVQRGSSGMVLRIINSEIPSFDELNLPPILEDISMTKRGLVIFVGGTGSGQEDSILTAMMEKEFGYEVTYIPFPGGGTVAKNLIGKHTGKPPWKRLTDEDLTRTINNLNVAAPKHVLLSAHDTCDHAVERFRNELRSEVRVLKAGETYRL